MDETSTTVVTPLLVFGDADAGLCADGVCALPPAQTAQAGPEPEGAAE